MTKVFWSFASQVGLLTLEIKTRSIPGGKDEPILGLLSLPLTMIKWEFENVIVRWSLLLGESHPANDNKFQIETCHRQWIYEQSIHISPRVVVYANGLYLTSVNIYLYVEITPHINQWECKSLAPFLVLHATLLRLAGGLNSLHHGRNIISNFEHQYNIKFCMSRQVYNGKSVANWNISCYVQSNSSVCDMFDFFLNLTLRSSWRSWQSCKSNRAILRLKVLSLDWPEKRNNKKNTKHPNHNQKQTTEFRRTCKTLQKFIKIYENESCTKLQLNLNLRWT